jgi:hypothetical protein
VSTSIAPFVEAYPVRPGWPTSPTPELTLDPLSPGSHVGQDFVEEPEGTEVIEDDVDVIGERDGERPDAARSALIVTTAGPDPATGASTRRCHAQS